MADVERYFAAPDRTVLSRQQATAAAYLSSNPSQLFILTSYPTASRASPFCRDLTQRRFLQTIRTRYRHAALRLVTISRVTAPASGTISEGLVGSRGHSYARARTA